MNDQQNLTALVFKHLISAGFALLSSVVELVSDSSVRNKKEMKMTAQEAFHKILTEEGVPMTPKELARIALEKGYVPSGAKDTVHSIAGTVAKNIREGKYNDPELVKIGRKIYLPSMQKSGHSTNEAKHNKKKTLTLELPEEIADKIQLATQAKLAESQKETVVLLLKAGLSAYAEEIRKNLLQQLNAI